MKEMIHPRLIKCAIVSVLLCSIMPLYADIPWLYVDGNTIRDPEGNVVILRGISLIDLGFLEDWQGGAINMIDRITDKNDSQGSSPGWYPKIIRLPICPADDWPYPFTPDDDSLYNNLLRPVVDYCAEKDLYVIIDRHYCMDTWSKFTQVSEFWRYMAPRFANDSHVLFELFNEPINDVNGDWIGNATNDWLSVRADMQMWVDIVRSYAPHNLILIGGPIWSQANGPAATYPVSGNNIVYVSHLYPGHWLDDEWSWWYMNQVQTCAAVHPVIITEWGFSSASEPGLNGTISNYGRPLMDFIEGLRIGNTAWVASYDWGPQMFYYDWTLRCGEREMGCFVKDTLYAKRNDDQPHGAIQTPVDLGSPSTEDFETNDFHSLAWRRSGDASWRTTRQESHSGSYSAKSGSIDDDESTTLEITLECAYGDITFYRKVSSESGFDHLKFYINGEEQDSWSGEQDWAEVSVPVDAGTRTFEWIYSKDGLDSDGDDAAWIDDITFPAADKTEPPEVPFTRGVNLTNWLQASSVQQIQFTKFTKQDLINIKNLGCDVIRLPINLHAMTSGSPDYTIDPLFHSYLDQIIDWAEDLELHLILDNHSLDPMVDTISDIGDILVPVWTQMAQHYKERSTYVYYEVLNEPHGISDMTWNRIQQEVIDAIRAVDQKHTIIVGPAGWNSYNNLQFMPEYEDDNLIYTFHFYDPFVFTHQGASWTDPSLEPLTGVLFPYYAGDIPACPPELWDTWIRGNLADYQNSGTVDRVKELIDIAVDFQRTRHVPLFCGEFGVYKPKSNNDCRLYWYSHVRHYLEQKGIAWTIWDYKGGFGLFEQGTGELFDYDLNIPLVRALGFTAPPQKVHPDTDGFDLYLDDIAPNIIESSWISNGILDYYCQDNPASGAYCIHWTGADLYNMISFRFSSVKNLSVLVDEGFALDFWVRCNDPSAKIDVGFVDTKTNERGDHPWHIRYTVDRNVADWNGQWNHLQIPLNAFFEIGSYDDGWFNPRGAYDWTATDHFEIVAEYHDLSGIHIYFDDIRVVESNPPIYPEKACNPDPPDGAQFISPNVTLNWTAGFSATSHHIYFGDNFSDVNAADTSDTTGIYRSVQTSTTYTLGPLELEKTYYWRVDEVEATRRIITIHKGDVWSFTTALDTTITDPNVLCWWTFDETEGTIAVDYSGHNHHGIVSGATWVANGGVGGALDFGGDGDHVIDEDAENYLNGLDALTVSMWVKSDVTNTDKGFLICKEPDLNDNVITMRYDSAGLYGGGTRVLKVAVMSTGGQQQLESSNNLQTTEWQHIVMTWSSGQALRFYVNGVLDSPTSNDWGKAGTLSGNMKLIIGKGGKDVGPSAGWDGMIDDVRIYNIALSEAEIYALGALSEVRTIPN